MIFYFIIESKNHATFVCIFFNKNAPLKTYVGVTSTQWIYINLKIKI